MSTSVWTIVRDDTRKSISVTSFDVLSTEYTTQYVALQSTVNCWLANTTVDKLNNAAIDFTSVVDPAKK